MVVGEREAFEAALVKQSAGLLSGSCLAGKHGGKKKTEDCKSSSTEKRAREE